MLQRTRLEFAGGRLLGLQASMCMMSALTSSMGAMMGGPMGGSGMTGGPKCDDKAWTLCTSYVNYLKNTDAIPCDQKAYDDKVKCYVDSGCWNGPMRTRPLSPCQT